MAKDSEFINKMAMDWFAWDGNESHCRTCNEPITDFRDELSEREFRISGMCQKCQDEVFNEK